jgi:hypothetical protein
MDIPSVMPSVIFYGLSNPSDLPDNSFQLGRPLSILWRNNFSHFVGFIQQLICLSRLCTFDIALFRAIVIFTFIFSLPFPPSFFFYFFFFLLLFLLSFSFYAGFSLFQIFHLFFTSEWDHFFNPLKVKLHLNNMYLKINFFPERKHNASP